MCHTAVLTLTAIIALFAAQVDDGWVDEIDGELTFARSNGRAIDIYTLSLPDGELTRHTDGPGTSTSPSWSPTGSELVFARRHGVPYNLYQLDTRTSTTQRLTVGTAIDGHPTHAPDGERIAFASNRGGSTDFHVYELPLASPDSAGSALAKPRRLAAGRSPAWSPVDNRIAFEREGRIWIHDLDVGTQQPLTTGRTHDVTPAWSPDGRQLVVSRGDREHRHLVVVDVASGATRALTQGTVHDTSPTWSPDGRWIAFVRATEDGSDLYVTEVSTGFVARVTAHTRSDAAPTWRPPARP